MTNDEGRRRGKGKCGEGRVADAHFPFCLGHSPFVIGHFPPLASTSGKSADAFRKVTLSKARVRAYVCGYLWKQCPRMRRIRFWRVMKALMTGIQERRPEALEDLYDRYSGILKSLIMGVIHNDAEADDLLQEIFMEIWNQAAHYSAQKGKPLGWIVTLTRRRSIDRLRKKQAYARAEERLQNETEQQPDAWVHNSTEDDIEMSDTRRLILGSTGESARGAAGSHRPGLLPRHEPAGDRRQDRHPAGHHQDPARVGSQENQ